MGIFPKPFLRKMDASVHNLLNQIHRSETYLVDKETAIKIPKNVSNLNSDKEQKENLTEPENNE
jgi:hypothetical protein